MKKSGLKTRDMDTHVSLYAEYTLHTYSFALSNNAIVV